MADAATIKVSTQVLRDTAGKIRRHNDTLDGKLKIINTHMDNLGDTWDSEASREIRAKMNGMKQTFEQYKEVVESYAKFLVDAAGIFEETETEAKRNASAFR